MNIEHAKLWLLIFNWIAAVGVIVTALAGVGKLYFETKVKELSEVTSAKEMENRLVVEENGRAVLDQDTPIVVETIEPHIGFSFSVYLEKGMQIYDNPSKWVVSGRNIQSEFLRDWNSGKVNIDVDKGVYKFDIKSPSLQLASPHNGKSEVPIRDLMVVYELKREYYLGFTGILPSSGELKDMISKKTKRTFNMNDFRQFDKSKFKKYSTFSEIPDQAADLIRVVTAPVIDQSMLNEGEFSAILQNEKKHP